MENKHKVLLQGLPNRNLFTALDYDGLTHQITTLVHTDINNFFIASTLSGISETLARGSSPNATDGPYFSDEFAWYSMSLVSNIWLNI